MLSLSLIFDFLMLSVLQVMGLFSKTFMSHIIDSNKFKC